MNQEYSAFQRALTNSVLKEYTHISEKKTDESYFSPEFQVWISKTIRKTQRRTWYYVNTTAKKAILVAVIISLLFFTAIAIPAIRKEVIELFIHEHENHFSITFDEKNTVNAPDHIEVVYSPTFIPDEYYLYSQMITSASVDIQWHDSDGRVLDFSQMIIPQNSNNDNWIGIDSEGVVQTQLNIGQYQVTLFTDANFLIAAWTDDSYFYTLHMPPDISLDTMEQIILSIEPMK